MSCHSKKPVEEFIIGPAAARERISSSLACVGHSIIVILKWQANGQGSRVFARPSLFVIVLMLIVLKLNPASSAYLSSPLSAGGGGGDVVVASQAFNEHEYHGNDDHQYDDNQDESELNKMVSPAMALSSFNGKDSPNHHLEAIGGQPVQSQEPFSSDPSSGLVVVNQQHQHRTQADNQKSPNGHGDRQHPSIVRTEFGDHAESSELDHQSATPQVANLTANDNKTPSNKEFGDVVTIENQKQQEPLVGDLVSNNGSLLVKTTNSTSIRPHRFELTTIYRTSQHAQQQQQQQRTNTTSKPQLPVRTRIRISAFRHTDTGGGTGVNNSHSRVPLVYLLNTTSFAPPSNWPPADQKMITYTPTPIGSGSSHENDYPEQRQQQLQSQQQPPYWKYFPISDGLFATGNGLKIDQLVSSPSSLAQLPDHHNAAQLFRAASNSDDNGAGGLVQSYELPYELSLPTGSNLNAAISQATVEAINNLMATDSLPLSSSLSSSTQTIQDQRRVVNDNNQRLVRGPFELDQLQAIASSLHNKQMHNSREDGPSDSKTSKRKPARTKSSGRPSVVATNTLDSNDDEPPDDEPSDDFGEPFLEGPLLMGGGQQLNDTTAATTNDDGERTEMIPNHSVRDIGGSSISIVKQQYHDNLASPGNTLGTTTATAAAITATPTADGGGATIGQPDEGPQINKTSNSAGESSSGKQAQLPSDGSSPARALIGATGKQANRKEQQHQQKQQQQPQQQRMPSIAGRNELLVGPFKSEAEAPATITLAGVVFQKSGASSALIRTAAPGGGGGHLRIASSHNKQRQGTSATTRPELDGIGVSASGSALISSPSSSSANQLGALGDWPASMVQQALTAQQPGTIYLGSLKSPTGTSSGSQTGASLSESLGAFRPFSFQQVPAITATSTTNYLGGSDQSSGAHVIRFSSFPAPIRNQLLATLSGATSGTQLATSSGNELSLSSSNTKLDSVAMNQQLGPNKEGSSIRQPTKELIITTTSDGLAAAASSGLLGSDRVPQTNSLTGGGGGSSTGATLHEHDSPGGLLGQLTGAGGGQSSQHATQLHQQRLPNGSIIWTLNKPSAQQHTTNSAQQMTSSSNQLSNFNNIQTNDAASLLEAAAVNQLASESKHHGDHKSSGPIVIVQKDVKPVKYHLLRAYLKLRRMLRPFEATYVFPNEASRALRRRNQARRWWAARGKTERGETHLERR